jgi:chitin synthase
VESVFKDNALAVNAEEEKQLQYQWGDDQRSIAFGKSLLALKNNPTPAPAKRSLKEKQQDYEKSFRTTVLIFWLFSNVNLGYLFTNNNFLRYAFPNYTLNPYLTFLFWTVALMSIFRLFGSIMYLSTS